MQALLAFTASLAVGAAGYQIKSNEAQSERISKLERDLPDLRNTFINLNDTIVAQFGFLHEKIEGLQSQRREAQEVLDVRLNHIDSLLGDAYSKLLYDSKRSD